jgi:hypothetical protein
VVILAFFDGVQFDFNLFPSILVLTSSSSSPSSSDLPHMKLFYFHSCFYPSWFYQAG